MAVIRSAGRLVLRLRRVIDSWPEDSSRPGRDLGGHLKEVLLPKYKSGAAEVRLSDFSLGNVHSYGHSYSRTVCPVV